MDAKSGGCIFILHYSNSLVRTIAESKYAKEGLLSSSDAMDNLLGIRRNMMGLRPIHRHICTLRFEL